MHINYVIACDSTYQTKDGKLIINGPFDTVFATEDPTEQKPVTQPTMTVVFSVEGMTPKTEEKFILKIYSVDGDDLVVEKEVSLTSSVTGKATSVGLAQLLQFKHAGDYKLSVKSTSDESIEAYTTLSVTVNH